MLLLLLLLLLSLLLLLDEFFFFFFFFFQLETVLQKSLPNEARKRDVDATRVVVYVVVRGAKRARRDIIATTP